MLSRIRRHLSPATIMAFVALVFAVTGGAFAATGGGSRARPTASAAKKKAKAPARGPAGPKGATGATGPAGPAGQMGPAGAKGETGSQGGQGPEGKEGKEGKAGTNGKDGTDGTNGTNGTNGESVTNTPLPKGNANCGEGGAEFKVGATGTPTYACNGKAGGGGSGTLESGKTETGVWSMVAGTTGNVDTTISFPIPLAIALGATAVHYVPGSGNGTTCPGTAAKPEATKGNFCVYNDGSSVNLKIASPGDAEVHISSVPLSFTEGTSTSGALLLFFREHAEQEAEANGSWALTGE